MGFKTNDLTAIDISISGNFYAGALTQAQTAYFVYYNPTTKQLTYDVSTGAGGGGVASEITLADESADTATFLTFANGATGDQALKTGSNLTFNSATGQLNATSFSGAGTGLTGTASSLTAGAVAAGNVTAGNLGSGVLPYFGTSSTNAFYRVPFMNTTGSTAGNYALLMDSASGFTYNPNTNTLLSTNISAGNFDGNGSSITSLNASNLDSGTVPSGRLSGSYGISITGNAATATSVSQSLSAGTGLSGSSYNGSTARTYTIASAYSPNTATDLGGSKNLNDYQTAGFYYQDNNADAGTGSNYPVASTAGSLRVEKSAGVTQMYHTYGPSNRLFFRAFYSSTWQSWKEVVTNSGTWGISISGNAATATSATSATSASSATNSTNATNLNVNSNTTDTGTSPFLFQLDTTNGNKAIKFNSAVYLISSTDKGYSADWIASSDVRKKKDIKPYGPVLDNLHNIKGGFCHFTWKDKGNPDVGYIAQEIKPYFPEVVFVPEDPSMYMGVSYSKMAGLAIEGLLEVDDKYKKEIQDLKTTIAEMNTKHEEDIKDLTSLVMELKREINELKK